MSADYTLLAKIIAEDGDFQKSMAGLLKSTKETQSETGKLAELARKVGGAIAGAFAVGKVLEFGKNVVETSARLNAMDAQFEQIFQGNQGVEALNRIKEASKDLGVHQDRLKGSFNQFGAQVKGAGMEASKAMVATDKATRLAADSAAFYDKSLEETADSLSSFMKGNFAAGDAIGVFTNAKQMDVQANKMYGKSWADLTEDERQWLLLDTVEKTYTLNGAMGQAAREAGGYENVMGNLKATWAEFMGVIGQPLLAAVISGMQMLMGIIGGLKTVMEPMVGAWQSAAEWMQKNKDIADMLAALFATLAIAIGVYAVAINAATIKTQALAAAKIALAAASKGVGLAVGFLTSPFGLAAAAIAALIVAGVLIVKNWDTIKAAAGQLVAWIKEKFGQMVEAISSWAQGIKEKFEGIKTAIGDVWTAIVKGISDALSNAKNAVLGWIKDLGEKFQSFWDSLPKMLPRAWEAVKKSVQDGMIKAWETIKGYADKFVEAGKNIPKSIADGIKAGIQWIKNAISNLVQKIRDFLPFSPAKEGPLRDLNKLNFGGTISESIYKGEMVVQHAMDQVLTLKQPLLDSRTVSYTSSGSYDDEHRASESRMGELIDEIKGLRRDTQKQPDDLVHKLRLGAV